MVQLTLSSDRDSVDREHYKSSGCRELIHIDDCNTHTDVAIVFIDSAIHLFKTYLQHCRETVELKWLLHT